MISKEQAPKEISRKISTGQVEHIAKLARIELSEKEKEKFANELSSILDYFEKLNQVDTAKIKPVSQVTGLLNITRGDESPSHTTGQAGIRNHELRDKILKETPLKKDNYFKVPKILE